MPDVEPPAALFSVDGRAIQTVTAPNNGSDTFQFPWFAFEQLDGSQDHTVQIEVLNATETYPFVLDYMIYLPPDGSTPTTGVSVVTTFLPPTGTPTAASASQGSSSGVPVGAIVGGVVGGVAVIVAAAIAIWLLCFRRRRSNGQPYFYASSAKAADLLESEQGSLLHQPPPLYADLTPAELAEVKPTPFDPPRPQSYAASSVLGPGSVHQPGPHTAPSAYSAPSQYNPPSGLGYSTHTPSEAPVSDYSSNAGGPSHTPSLVLASGSMPRVTASPNQTRSKAAEAGLLSVPQDATYHADSGVRFDANGQPITASGSSSSSSANVLAPPELADVPPSYSAT